MNYTRTQSQWAKVVKDGLVLWYDFYNKNSYPGSGTAIVDLSKTCVDGTLVNSPTTSTDIGGCLVLDGTNDYIDTNVTASQLGIYDNPFTFTVVYSFDNDLIFGGSLYIVGNSSGGTNRDSLQLGYQLNAYEMGVDDNTSINTDIGIFPSAATGVWDVITYTHSGTKGKIYVNGVLAKEGTLATFIGTGNILIGRSNTSYFDGNFAAIMIHNRELTQAEIVQNYNAYKGRLDRENYILDSNVELLLDASDPNSYPGTGTTWTDLSGNSNTGTLTNGPTYSEFYRGAIVFDNTNDYVKVNDHSTLNPTGAITISVFAKVQSYTSTGTLVFKKNTSVSYFEQYHLYVVNAGIYFVVSEGTVGTQIFAEVLGDYMNKDVHIVGVADTVNDIIKLYVDGVLMDTTTWTGSFQTSTNPVQIGAIQEPSSVSTMGGLIYHVSIHSVALSSREITRDYAILRNRFGK